MVQKQWYLFGIGAPPILVYFIGDWDVHWGHGVLIHGQLEQLRLGKRRCLTQMMGSGHPLANSITEPQNGVPQRELLYK